MITTKEAFMIVLFFAFIAVLIGGSFKYLIFYGIGLFLGWLDSQ